jgi:lipoate-protein ligase A
VGPVFDLHANRLRLTLFRPISRVREKESNITLFRALGRWVPKGWWDFRGFSREWWQAWGVEVQEWKVERADASVRDLHAVDVPDGIRRTIRWCVPTDTALVLGSAQPETDVDKRALERNGVDLVRRRSGGGAVLVQPGALVWVDVLIPRSDPLWVDDVGLAFHWLGQVWSRALMALEVGGVTLHEGSMVNTEWSRKICFAGLGPGECLVDGRKVVGISQKRTREAAWFQSSVLLRFDPRSITDLLLLTEQDADRAVADLERGVSAISRTAEAIERAFTSAIRTV